MTSRARVASYVAALVLAFGLAYGIGALTAPSEPPAPPHLEHGR